MSAEGAARRTAAAAALADFAEEMAAEAAGERLSGTAWTGWAFRLAEELRSILEQLAAEQPPAATAQPAATSVAPDGGAWLTHADMLTVLGALSDAREYRRSHPYPDLDDMAAIVAYSAVAWRLGDDR